MTSSPQKRALVLVCVLVLTLAGCGRRGIIRREAAAPETSGGAQQSNGAVLAPGAISSGPGGIAVGGGRSGTNTQVPTRTLKERVITIGSSRPLTGPLRASGEQGVAALDAFIQLINDRGGINGAKLRLVSLDDAGDCNRNFVNIKRLVEQYKALLVGFAYPCSFDYLERQSVPYIPQFGYLQIFRSRYKNAFVVGPAGHIQWSLEAVTGFMEISKLPIKRTAILWESSVWPDTDKYAPLVASQWKAYGTTVTSTDPYTLSDGDCTSLTLKVRAANIDFWDFESSGWPLCIHSAERIGYKPPQGWGGLSLTSTPIFLNLATKWADGIWGGAYWENLDGRPGVQGAGWGPRAGLFVKGNYEGIYPAMREYFNAMKKYHPREAKPEIMMDSPAVGGWIWGKFVVDVLRGIGGANDRRRFIEYGHTLKYWQADFVPPHASFAPDCKTGSEYVWNSRWHLKGRIGEDDAWQRTPETPWMSSHLRDKYGVCHLNRIAEKLYG